MRNFKNFLPLFAILLGVGIVFTQSAFKNAKSRDMKVYQYTQTDNERLYDETAWALVTSSPESCIEGEILPCVIQFNTEEFANLEAYLVAHPELDDILSDTDNLVSDKDGVIIDP